MMTIAPLNWTVRVQGVVQSVGFRPFVKNLADRLGVAGEIQNLGSAGVKIEMRATQDERDQFIEKMKTSLPDLAFISHISITSAKDRYFNDFSIIPSIKSEHVGGVALPPDISICDQCAEDINNDPRRLQYPFTSCTNCGPRYSAIRELPYDRINTSYHAFPLCVDCEKEYTTPQDRRFHAQTTACRLCGPRYRFYKSEGDWKEEEIGFDKIAGYLESGKIIALMGVGGTHVLANPFNDEVVQQLRKRRRKDNNKPFAVLVRDLTTAHHYAWLSKQDEKLLTSKRRPIVVVPHKSRFSKHISPQLNSIGLALPYSGVHYVLFSYLDLDAIIFTSANLPGLPMPTTAEEVLRQLKQSVDYAVVHNREIIQRVDDSVIRSHGDHHHIIRRSRGYTPQPYFHKDMTDLNNIVSLGAEEVNTACLGVGELLISTQHLGHLVSSENLDFQREAIIHLLGLYNIEPNVVLTDLHPTFLQRKNAQWLIDQYDVSQYDIQHHVAHAASLALDHQIGLDEDLLVWACDGYGYGTDGNAWGGELIMLEEDSFQRLSHIPEFRYDGGDINALYPDRMLFLLSQSMNKELPAMDFKLKHGDKEFQYLASLVNSNPTLVTTSMGRLLDAFSALLGRCHYRTYRGEPAMVLEGLAFESRNPIGAEVFVKSDRIDLETMFSAILTRIDSGEDTADIAAYILRSIGVSLAEVARIYAESQHIFKVGFSGGVAYNQLICDSLHTYLSKFDLEFLKSDNIPPGDAGISAGQIYYYMKSTKRKKGQ